MLFQSMDSLIGKRLVGISLECLALVAYLFHTRDAGSWRGDNLEYAPKGFAVEIRK
jgi:hypothetical protein